MTRKQLETATIDAHAHVEARAQFCPAMAGDAAAAEPHDVRRFHRLVPRLTALVAAGNLDGQQPVGDGEP